MTERLAVDPAKPDRVLISRAAEALRAGRLVIFPTDTLYGLGANALDDAAVGLVFEAKRRPADNPVPVLIASAADLGVLAADIPRVAEKLIERFWPGALTIVLPKTGKISALAAGGGTSVGFRVPAHAVALALIREAGFPVVGPSANLSGEEPPADARNINPLVLKQTDLLIDAGPAPLGVASTVVDFSSGQVTVLREGAISKKTLENVIE